MPKYNSQPEAAIRPEVELLLCCARTSIEPERIERIKSLLKEEIDWVYLIRMMLAHGMLPLLYKALKTACAEAVPASTLEQLRRQFEAIARRNAFMAEELIRILTLLKRHGIIAIPFKGPVLAALAYGDISLRQFADLDILVKKPEVFRARDLLISELYRPHSQLTASEQEARLQSNCEFAFISPDSKIAVELHWRITPKYFSFPMEMSRLWERLDYLPLAGRSVPTLRAEELLLILCVHGAKHRWQRLDWICDIAELVRTHAGVDWEYVVQQADRLGVQRMLLVGLLLANDLLGATLPDKVSRRIESDTVIEMLAGPVRKRLFHDVEASPEVSDRPVSKDALPLGLIHFHLRSRERLRDRIRYCLYFGNLAITPTKKDREFLRLPASLSLLYYLLRPVRLAGEYGLKPFMKTLMYMLGRQEL
ncbi:MAG TPA: nucleotidyltransferase family protein [Blastocatellia bacterium]